VGRPSKSTKPRTLADQPARHCNQGGRQESTDPKGRGNCDNPEPKTETPGSAKCTTRVISPFLVVKETDLTCPSGEVWSVLMIPKRHFRRGPSSSIKTTSPMEILVLPETFHDCFRLIRSELKIWRYAQLTRLDVVKSKEVSLKIWRYAQLNRLDVVKSKEVSLKIWRYAQLNRLDVVKSKEVSLKIWRYAQLNRLDVVKSKEVSLKIWRYAQLNRLDVVKSKEVSLKIWRYAQLNRLDVVKSKEVSLKIWRYAQVIRPNVSKSKKKTLYIIFGKGFTYPKKKQNALNKFLQISYKRIMKEI
ncbi:hypothetical protein Avbf_05134, partial [Armadillidium vulgare]